MDVYYNDIKPLPIVEYLAYKGFLPHSKITNEAYYFCPYRHESRPSLAVNMDKNIWFDFGDNVGGSIIDLALRLYNGDRVKANEDLVRFSSTMGVRGSIPNDNPQPEKESRTKNGIRIINVKDLSHPALLQLITSRGIGIEVAKRYCKEVWFESKGGRRCFAIGLPNVVKGWELRGLKSFKSSTQPKAVSLIRTSTNHNRVSVFEGLFDMLSYAAYCYLIHNAEPSCDLLCLNSLSLLNASYHPLCGYKEIDLYLDADNPGIEATTKLLKLHANARDRSTLYSCTPNCKDLNQWYIQCLQNL